MLEALDGAQAGLALSDMAPNLNSIDSADQVASIYLVELVRTWPDKFSNRRATWLPSSSKAPALALGSRPAEREALPSHLGPPSVSRRSPSGS